MAFQFRKDAAKWFKHVEPSPFEVDFDKYYMCLMAGLAVGRRGSSKVTLGDMTDTFPQSWKEKARLIIGLLLSTHLEDLAVSWDERDTVNKEMALLLDPDSPTKLSAAGMRLLNEYASGGFEVLVEMGQPYAPETLLRGYVDVIRKAVAERLKGAT